MKVKIKELPEIRYTGIVDSDLMLVETSSDTYKMTIGDAKALFSSDEKINALDNKLSLEISNYEEITNVSINNLAEQVTEISQNISNNNTNLSNVVKRVATLESSIVETNTNVSQNAEDIVELSLRIDNNDTLLETHETHLTSIDNSIIQIKKNITNLQTLTKSHTESISTINKTLTSLQEQIDQININTSEDLSEQVVALKQMITDKYDEIEAQIEFWHHDPDNSAFVKI